VGPFVAGSTSSDLISLAGQVELGLRLLEREEQAQDYYRARCEALVTTAREFFFPYERSSALVFQKTRDNPDLPDFIEYIYCWLAENRLCGTILSGVTSDAGTHDQMNEQEADFWEHCSEVAEALLRKYPEDPESFINYFNFDTFPAQPQMHGSAPAGLFTSYQRLVTTTVDNEPTTRVETHYCGPSLISPAFRKQDSDIPTAATHSNQSQSRMFASNDCLVVYDFKIERYVRTIESIHVFENLIYVSRTLANDLGRRLNSQRCALVAAEAQAEIEARKESERLAEEARKPESSSSRRSFDGRPTWCYSGCPTPVGLRVFAVSPPSWNSTSRVCPSGIRHV
jgi:hypothetical protein